jgi:hypothetical protein
MRSTFRDGCAISRGEASADALADVKLELQAELARDYVNLRGFEDQAVPPCPRGYDDLERRLWDDVLDSLPDRWVDPAAQDFLRRAVFQKEFVRAVYSELAQHMLIAACCQVKAVLNNCELVKLKVGEFGFLRSRHELCERRGSEARGAGNQSSSMARRIAAVGAASSLRSIVGMALLRPFAACADGASYGQIIAWSSVTVGINSHNFACRLIGRARAGGEN